MMKLKLPRTNIEEKLKRVRNKRDGEENVLFQVHAILNQENLSEEQILQNLRNGSFTESNNFRFALLESKQIFHISDIEKICIDYRLRFLDSKYFKGKMPYETLVKIKQLEKAHEIQLKGFKIMAPSKLFKLENADDPLLMAPMGNDYYYLVHKWGNDLHPFRKLLMWPFKNLENFAVLLLLISLLFTCMVPDGLFSEHTTTSEFLMIFFFMFKWVAGLALFIGFKKGKNFSSSIWKSKYYNA